jgi:hypothetical protein
LNPGLYGIHRTKCHSCKACRTSVKDITTREHTFCCFCCCKSCSMAVCGSTRVVCCWSAPVYMCVCMCVRMCMCVCFCVLCVCIKHSVVCEAHFVRVHKNELHVHEFAQPAYAVTRQNAKNVTYTLTEE